MVATDRISTYDVVHPTPIPDKGAVLTGLSAFWFERTGDDRPQPPDLGHRRRARRGARPRRMVVRKLEDAARSSASCAATSRARAGRTTSATAPSAGIALPDGLQESEQLPEPIFTPSTKAEVGPRRDRRLRPARPSSSATRRCWSELRDAARWRSTRVAAEHARERGMILADTKFEFGLDADGDAARGRRGAHAGLLALLARRRLRARPRRSRRSTSSTCATGPRAPAGTRSRPRRRSPTTSSRRTREKYVEAYERITGEPFSRLARPHRRREGARARSARRRASSTRRARRWSARCRRSASRASRTCTSAGWSSSTSRTPERLPEMCETLLANPLIEDYEILERRLDDASAWSAFPAPATSVDALLAADRVGEAELLWHADRDLHGVDAVIVPGGFSYGDYLRVGAIARFAPVMASVLGLRRATAARCWGSATASRCCARPACCPARCSRTPRCVSSAGRSRSRS